MRFSTRTEYGIRILVRLGRVYGKGPVALSELAEVEHLPLSYLEQIAGQLRRSGLVQSRMGAHGGYLLGRPPGSGTMGGIVTSLEGALAPVSRLGDGEAEGHSAGEAWSAQSLE